MKGIFIAAVLLLIFGIALWANSADSSLVDSLLVLKLRIFTFFRALL